MCTVFEFDVFDGIVLEQVVVLVGVTHERKENLLNDDEHVRLEELPRVERGHSRERERNRSSQFRIIVISKALKGDVFTRIQWSRWLVAKLAAICKRCFDTVRVS